MKFARFNTTDNVDHLPATKAGPQIDPASQELSHHADENSVVVYWRPGCPFCSRLVRQLNKRNIEFNEIDIWSDPQAAAFVRSVAGGHETVPTVTVGDQVLVNPSADRVATLIQGRT